MKLWFSARSSEFTAASLPRSILSFTFHWPEGFHPHGRVKLCQFKYPHFTPVSSKLQRLLSSPLKHLLLYTAFSHSVVSDSLWPHGLQPSKLLCPWGFSRQEHWSGLPCPIPVDLPNPGIEPRSPTLQVDSLPSEPPGKPITVYYGQQFRCLFPN